MSASYECPFCKSTDLWAYQLLVDQRIYNEKGWRYYQNHREEPLPLLAILRCKNCKRPFTSKEIPAHTLPEVAKAGPGWLGTTRDRNHLYFDLRAKQKPGHCVFCGKDLADIKYKPTRYCSSECRGNTNVLLWQNIRYNRSHKVKWCCEECGGRYITVHHIIPVALGGTSEESNLIALCEACHKARHIILQPHMDRKRRELKEILGLNREVMVDLGQPKLEAFLG